MIGRKLNGYNSDGTFVCNHEMIIKPFTSDVIFSVKVKSTLKVCIIYEKRIVVLIIYCSDFQYSPNPSILEATTVTFNYSCMRIAIDGGDFIKPW